MLEFTVHVSAPLTQVSAPRPGTSQTHPISLGSVSTRLSHGRVHTEVYRQGQVLKSDSPRFQPWFCLFSLGWLGKPLDLLESPFLTKVELRKPTLLRCGRVNHSDTA